MSDLLKGIDELLAGWTRHERQVPDYVHLTETWWQLDSDSVRHVEGKGVLLVQAVLKGETHTLSNIGTLTHLATLIGGHSGP